jgi:NAD(P)-dependent dehydrogenase (short-subunit alcohol dehydrogenase family)
MNRHVLVAGASSGIGAACVERFAADGDNVTAIARHKPTDFADGRSTHFIVADMTLEREVVDAIGAAESRFGPISTVVHSIGFIEQDRSIAAIDHERLLKSFATNFGSAFLLAKHVVERLARAGERGSFVAVSSVASTSPYPGIADYCAAKSALTNLVKSLALELAEARARANAVAPAVVRTPIFERAPFDEHIASSWHKLGRIGEPSEVAALVHYLAGSDAAWITGQEFTIDGGMRL